MLKNRVLNRPAQCSARTKSLMGTPDSNSGCLNLRLQMDLNQAEVFLCDGLVGQVPSKAHSILVRIWIET